MSILDTTPDTHRKKLDALEQARRRYMQAIYGYLPCLSMPDDAGIALTAIELIKRIAEWHEVALMGNGPKTSNETGMTFDPPLYNPMFVEEVYVAPLDEQEQAELRSLIAAHKIFVARDPDTQEMTMTHPAIMGAFHPLNEREVLEVARDIAGQTGDRS